MIIFNNIFYDIYTHNATSFYRKSPSPIGTFLFLRFLNRGRKQHKVVFHRRKLLDKFLSPYYFSGHHTITKVEFLFTRKETDHAKTH